MPAQDRRPARVPQHAAVLPRARAVIPTSEQQPGSPHHARRRIRPGRNRRASDRRREWRRAGPCERRSHDVLMMRTPPPPFVKALALARIAHHFDAQITEADGATGCQAEPDCRVANQGRPVSATRGVLAPSRPGLPRHGSQEAQCVGGAARAYSVETLAMGSTPRSSLASACIAFKRANWRRAGADPEP
jgi:hypothetical protein